MCLLCVHVCEFMYVCMCQGTYMCISLGLKKKKLFRVSVSLQLNGEKPCLLLHEVTARGHGNQMPFSNMRRCYGLEWMSSETCISDIGLSPGLQLTGSEPLQTWNPVGRKAITEVCPPEGFTALSPFLSPFFASQTLGLSSFLCLFMPTVMPHLSSSTKSRANKTIGWNQEPK